MKQQAAKTGEAGATGSGGANSQRAATTTTKTGTVHGLCRSMQSFLGTLLQCCFKGEQRRYYYYAFVSCVQNSINNNTAWKSSIGI